MKTTRKGLRLLALTLCMAVMLGLAVPALAAPISAYGKVIADNTKVYATKDKTTVIGTFAKNDIVAIESQDSQKDVYIVRTSAGSTATGYIERGAITRTNATAALAIMKPVSGGTAATTGTIVNVSSYANMRDKASTSGSTVIEKPTKGATVTILGESGSYYQVSYNGKTGYISKTYVKVNSSSSSSGGSTSTTTGTIYNVSSYANMRAAANTTSSATRLNKGTVVTILGESGSFYQVSYNGKTGYVDKRYVQVSSGSSGSGSTTGTPGVIYNVSSYANMRNKASASGSLVAKPPKGASVTILGQSGNFYQVSYDGKTGYIDKRYVQAGSDATTPPTTGTIGGKDTGVVTVGKGDIKVAPFGSTTPSAIKTKLDAAEKANSDVIGYISINGTNISHPILFRKGDVHYYATHDAKKKSSSSGAIYAFYGDMVRNNTITGHNMRQSGTMLHQLHYLQEKTLGFTVHQTTDAGAKKGSLTNIPSLAVAANRLWNISLFGYNQWQVWAMYETPANESTSTLKYNINPLSSYSPSQVKSWIEYQKNRSEYKFNTAVSTDDIFLTVYTCGNNYDYATAQSRIYYFLKAVK